jgi:flagellar hook-associated protein 2
MSSTSSSLFTPLQFTGISQYSSDFQSILTRAVGIAQIPLQSLQQREATITTQESDLANVGSAVSAVQSALVALGNLGAGQALSASSSNSSVVTATNTGATQSSSYTITSVTSIASAASEMSLSSFADPATTQVSTTGKMSLTLGSTSYPITLGSGQNNLQGLLSAIQALNVGVSPSIITTKSGSYLSISASSPGATTLKLTDDPTGANKNILTSTNQGTDTVFQLGSVTVSEPSTTINDVIPGVTLSFTGTSNTSTVINVSTDRTQLSTALQQLATSYNALVAADNQQTSATPGSLSGNNIIYQIASALTSIVQYQGTSSSGMNNLANLGIEIGDDGQMSLNSSTFNALSDSQISSALQLLGNSTTGIGGLQQTFAQIADPVSGSIATQENQWKNTVTNLGSQITTMTAQITQMEQSLNQQLQAADASVAELASPQSSLTASIPSLDDAASGDHTRTTRSKSSSGRPR